MVPRTASEPHLGCLPWFHALPQSLSHNFFFCHGEDHAAQVTYLSPAWGNFLSLDCVTHSPKSHYKCLPQHLEL